MLTMLTADDRAVALYSVADDILITGPDGQIGWELLQVILKRPFITKVVGLRRSEMDLTNPAAIRKKVREVQPALIINAAGYTRWTAPKASRRSPRR